MKNIRNREKGNATVMVTALTILSAIMIVGAAKVWSTMGASKEAQNSTEAGALNMGAKSFTLRTKLQDVAEQQFSDLLDSQQSITLTNVNRVWAKTLLASINVNAMNNTGHGSAAATQHAELLFNAAQSINDRLAAMLNNPKDLYGFFNDMAEKNLVSMSGISSPVQAVQDPKYWTTALVDRNVESNICLNSNQIPQAFDYKNLQTKSVNGQDRLPGYCPIAVLDRKFCFVPFKQGARTELISAENFQTNTISAKPLPATKNPMPNAFATEGKGINNPYNGTAFVLANPQRNFDLSMPDAFVRVHLDPNEAQVYIGDATDQLIASPVTVPYDYCNDQYLCSNDSRRVIMLDPYDDFIPDGYGSVQATFMGGQEYGKSCNLYEAIFNRRQYENVFETLLKTVCEIKPNCTPIELVNALVNQKKVHMNHDYIIYAQSSGSNGSDSTLMVADVMNVTNPKVNTKGQADGQPFALYKEDDQVVEAAPYLEAGKVTDNSNIFGPDPLVNLLPTAEREGHIYWAPGSGFDGCLGTLTIARTTTLHDHGAIIDITGGLSAL